MTKTKRAQASAEDKAIDEYLVSQGRNPLDAVFTYAGQDMHERWPHRYQSTDEYESAITAEVKAYLDEMPLRLRQHLRLLIDRYAERRGPTPLDAPASERGSETRC